MLIEESQALHFIDHYQTLLGYAALSGGLLKKAGPQVDGLALMTTARNAIAKDPALLTKAMAAMAQAGEQLPEDMQQAVASLRVNHWVYLRDTTGYSVLLETGDREAGYAVKCLTTPLKELMGDSGAIIEAGLLEYHGQIVCDGLVSLGAWVGPNYRSGFNATLAEFRTNGLFFRDRLLPVSMQKPAAPKRRSAGGSKKSGV
ncbi:hypothetical protein G7047_01575 [Diaphorobacter sp. HDW4A]|uniref:hypothetical protein n=1 Tax=Diaphorobacter sp. HDW4A TaxID=2714924 RepID=UPI00140D60F8|nr:hypothetical protein [Diaphorobacter sp. HDW4A]QIL78760.1 hypothetical protein G7047_01575 [Diaphorobacter sp. HDW4A]